MKLLDCVNKIDIELINQASLEQEVTSIYIGDLLSMVMGRANENSLWITVQTHLNAIAVAEMLDFSGVIFVEGLLPDDDTVKKANELNIPLLRTHDDAYTLAKKLASIGI